MWQNLLILAIPLAFVLFWSFTIWHLAWLGGWRALGKKYGVQRLPTGKKYSWQSASFQGGSAGWQFPCNYGSCLTMIVCDQGLGLAVSPIFRVGHPPLLIPWSEFYSPRQKTVLWYWKFFAAEIGEPAIVTVCLPGWLFEQANRAMTSEAAYEGTKEHDDAH